MSKAIARQLRKNQTEAEKLLWEQLRNRRLHGYKFRRQYPIAAYFADFVCFSAGLVIELDGSHHAETDQKAYDDERTKILTAGGYHVLRFQNHQVQKNMQEVLQQITKTLKSLPESAPSPSGRGGRGVRATNP